MQTRPKSREQGWFQLLLPGRSPPPRPPLGPTTPAWPSTWGSSWQRPRCGQTCLSTYLQLFRWPNHFWDFIPVKFAKMTFVVSNNFMQQSNSIATVPGSGMVAPISGLSTGLAKAQVWINTIFNRHKPMMLLLTLLSDKSFFFLGKPWGETSYPLQRRWWQNWSPGESSQQRSIFYCFGEASLNYKFFAQECLSVLSPKGLQQHWVASGLATKSSKSMESTLLASPLTRCVPQEDFVIVMWPDCISSGAWPDEKGGREQHNNGCQGSALWEDPHPSQGIHLRNKHGIAFSNQLLLFAQDSSGHIGFQFKDGKITSIAVDSSAARYFFLDATMFLSLLSLSKLLALTFYFSLFRALQSSRRHMWPFWQRQRHWGRFSDLVT